MCRSNRPWVSAGINNNLAPTRLVQTSCTSSGAKRVASLVAAGVTMRLGAYTRHKPRCRPTFFELHARYISHDSKLLTWRLLRNEYKESYNVIRTFGVKWKLVSAFSLESRSASSSSTSLCFFFRTSCATFADDPAMCLTNSYDRGSIKASHIQSNQPPHTHRRDPACSSHCQSQQRLSACKADA